MSRTVLNSAQRTELTKLQEADREKAAKARKAKSENKRRPERLLVRIMHQRKLFEQRVTRSS